MIETSLQDLTPDPNPDTHHAEQLEEPPSDQEQGESIRWATQRPREVVPPVKTSKKVDPVHTSQRLAREPDEDLCADIAKWFAQVDVPQNHEGLAEHRRKECGNTKAYQCATAEACDGDQRETHHRVRQKNIAWEQERHMQRSEERKDHHASYEQPFGVPGVSLEVECDPDTEEQ